MTGLRRLILPAAAVAAILLGAGLALALTGQPASRSPAATATAPASPAGTAGSAQGQPQVPRVSLASVRWSGFYGVELPVSAQAGPFDTSAGVAAGFAHTPLGALLAAVNIGVRANAQWGPRIFTEVIRRQVTGPDAAALLAACQAAYDQAAQSDGVTRGQPLGTVDVTEQAFRWITYTPSAVRLAVRDDGVGGADPARGSGLLGLYDRVEAAGGTITIHSPNGEGTEVLVELPLRPVPAPD